MFTREENDVPVCAPSFFVDLFQSLMGMGLIDYLPFKGSCSKATLVLENCHHTNNEHRNTGFETEEKEVPEKEVPENPKRCQQQDRP